MPRALQAIGWALRPLPLMRRAGERHGDLFTLRIRRGRPWVLTSHPENVKRLFTARAEDFRAAAGEANPLLGPLLGPQSVMLRDEPGHMVQRRFMLPAFHGERMRGYGEMVLDVARREIVGWPVGEAFVLWPRMQAISMEVVMRAVFGERDLDRLARLRALLKRMTDWLNDQRRLTMLSALGPRWLERDGGFRRVVSPVEEAVLAEVRRRRALGSQRDGEGILALLEQAHDEDGSPMGEPELRDELITLLSDGPTATSLAWAFERLLRHPEKLARLRDEALAADGEETYVDAVVKETLRLCPAVPLVMRRLVEPTRFGDYVIPADTTVAACVHLVHHREDVYPRSWSFLPERFLDSPAGTYTWIPFGGGVRRCVAASFAQMEMRRVIQTVVREVELIPASGGSAHASRSSVAFAPADAQVVVRRRVGAERLGSPNILIPKRPGTTDLDVG